MGDKLGNMHIHGTSLHTRLVLALKTAVGLDNGLLLRVSKCNFRHLAGTHQGLSRGHHLQRNVTPVLWGKGSSRNLCLNLLVFFNGTIGQFFCTDMFHNILP